MLSAAHVLGSSFPHAAQVFLINDGASAVAIRHYYGLYVLVETIKRSKYRVDVQKLDPTADLSGAGFLTPGPPGSLSKCDIHCVSNERVSRYCFPGVHVIAVLALCCFLDCEGALLLESCCDRSDGMCPSQDQVLR